MHIHRFESDFDPKILARGKQYFAEGLVGELSYGGDGTYYAFVEGTELYEVEVRLAPDGAVLDTTCDCPYDWGNFCKHQAAVLYAIREERSRDTPALKEKPAKKKPDLQALLTAQPKETLVLMLLALAQKDRTLRQSLLLRFGSPENEIEQSRRLVKGAMYSPKGYWEYGEVDDALEGAWTVLERAEESVETDCERAVRLCLVVLPEAVGLLEYCDDSNGEVGGVLAACTRTMKKAVEAGWHTLPSEQRALVFQMILDEALDDAYEGWDHFRLELWDVLVACCDDAALRETLYQTLQHQRQLSTKEHDSYYNEALAGLQLDILLQWDAPGEAREFIETHLGFSSFRKRAIALAMDRADYSSALSLALDGMKTDGDYPGHMHHWRVAAYQAHEALGNGKKALELAEYFLLNEADGFAYYPVVKNGYPAKEWPKKFGNILMAFEAQPYPSRVYVEILLEEKRFDRLIEYCRRHPEILPGLASKFPDKYKISVVKIYRDLILRRASEASNRSHYKRVCEMLWQLGQDVDKPGMGTIALELKTMYPRRPAFQDELNQLI